MLNYKSDIGGGGKAGSGFTAIGFFVLAVIALYLPDPSQDEVASLLRGTVLRPFISTQEALVRRSVHAEDTETLQARLDSLEVVIANGRTLSEENAQLRSLLGLPERRSAQYVSASVIRAGTPGSESMFQLDVGVRQGVTRDAAVITARGLLGVVRTAGATSATGWDWTHPQFRASAMTEDGLVTGMVQATPGSFREGARLLLDGGAYQDVLKPGVVLVTSGLGSVYPRGILIGVVMEESDSQEGWRRSYWLRPFVSPGEATHALVQVSEAGESGDASSWSEDGPVAPGAEVAEVAKEPVVGTADTEARTRQ